MTAVCLHFNYLFRFQLFAYISIICLRFDYLFTFTAICLHFNYLLICLHFSIGGPENNFDNTNSFIARRLFENDGRIFLPNIANYV